MSNTCRILIMELNGDYKSIYCLYDGQPHGTGHMLKQFYNTKKKVKDLIELGDILKLGEYLRPTPDMVKVKKDMSYGFEHSVTISYRDVFLEASPAIIFEDLHNRHFGGVDFIYLFQGTTWYYKEGFLHEGQLKYDKVDWKVVA